MIRIPYLHDSGYLEIAANDLRWTDQFFSHLDLDGVYRHFDIAKLWRQIEASPKKYQFTEFAVISEQAEYLVKNHGIDRGRLSRITRADVKRPGIIVEFADAQQLVIDGNHRYVRRLQLGFETMHFYVLTEAQVKTSLLAIPPSVAVRILRHP